MLYELESNGIVVMRDKRLEPLMELAARLERRGHQVDVWALERRELSEMAVEVALHD